MCHRTFEGEAAFTLLEVLVAILIFTIGMLGTLVLTTTVVRGNFFSRNVTSATAVAQNTLEGAHRAGYAGVSAYVADSTKVPAYVTLGGTSFSQTASVVNGSPGVGLKRVSVTVGWNEVHTARAITLETILAE
jgi:type IV pilus assembly protein PilV